MTTTTTAQALTTKQPGDIVSDLIGSVSFQWKNQRNLMKFEHFQ